MSMNIWQAVEAMRAGKKVRFSEWKNDDDPLYLVLIPGREITASFEPMVTHLGEGTKFLSLDHVDAVYAGALGPVCKVGYEFGQQEILWPSWVVVE